MTDQETKTVTSQDEAFRLPTDAVPRKYAIHLTADPADEGFTAELTVALDVRKPTDRIVLHAKELEVGTATIEQGGSSQECAVEVDAENEAVNLTLDNPLKKGEATLTIQYAGTVGQAMAGLYHSADGAEVCLATQCEATDARRIFPCFDEPAFKAEIEWTVTTGVENRVLANGPLKARTENADGKTATWRFEATPPISSYLAAVAIGAFGATDETIARGVPFRVHALGGKQRLGTHARDFAARLLPWYEDYFGAKYPFGKYDQIAVPSFSFGAMENVGLVVFRASLLLTDPKTTSWQGRKVIDLVVAHEFAHMWFGNTVTMAWWDDLWLNEAFAEWIAHKAVDDLEPTHDVWHDFQGRSFGAMATDALGDTHAVYNPVKTPAEAREMFDAITYGKGSAVLRMLEAYLGAETFRKGLRTYMQAFHFDNARGADLWKHLGEAADEPVTQIMDSWLNQPGHPVISVTAETKDGHVELTLTQRRARSSPLLGESDQSWRVPLVIKLADEAGLRTERVLLDKRTDTARLPVTGALKFLLANEKDLGFYLFDPDDGLRAMLSENAHELDPTERTAFLRDQWGLVRAGEQDVAAFLDLFVRLADGADHYTVVDFVVSLARDLERLLEHAGDEQALAAYRAWVADRFQKPLATLGMEPRAEDEDPPTRQRRATLVRAVAGIGRDAAGVKEVRALAAREREDPASVDANVAGTAVSIAALHGDADHFGVHLGTYTARRDAHAPPQEVERYLYTLAAFREPKLVERTLKLLDDGTAPKQGIGPLLRLMLGEPHAQRQAWIYLRENWEAVRARVGDSWVMILVEAAGSLPPDLNDEVVSFFEATLDGLATQSFKRAKERLAERAELFDRVLDDLVAWARGLTPGS